MALAMVLVVVGVVAATIGVGLALMAAMKRADTKNEMKRRPDLAQRMNGDGERGGLNDSKYNAPSGIAPPTLPPPADGAPPPALPAPPDAGGAGAAQGMQGTDGVADAPPAAQPTAPPPQVQHPPQTQAPLVTVQLGPPPPYPDLPEDVVGEQGRSVFGGVAGPGAAAAGAAHEGGPQGEAGGGGGGGVGGGLDGGAGGSAAQQHKRRLSSLPKREVADTCMIPSDRDECNQLLKSMRQSERAGYDRPNPILKRDKELQKWVENHQTYNGRSTCMVDLLYPGEPLGLCWRAESEFEHVEIMNLDPGKAGERNGLPKSGYITKIAGHECRCFDDMRRILEALTLQGITSFPVEVSDEDPGAAEFSQERGEVSGPLRHILDSLGEEWVGEQEALLSSNGSPMSMRATKSTRATGPAMVGNAANSMKFGFTSPTVVPNSPTAIDTSIRKAEADIKKVSTPRRVSTTKSPAAAVVPAHLRRIHGSQVRDDV